MKILIVDPFATSPNYTNTITHYLSELNNKVYLVGANKSINNMSQHGKKVIRFNFISNIFDYPLAKKFYFFQSLVRVILYPFALIKIYLILKRNNIEVLHFQWSHIVFFEIILIFFAKKKCKVVYTFHNTTLFHGERHPLKEFLSSGTRLLLNLVDAVIVHTNYSRETFGHKYPKIINKINVVPRGRDYFLSKDEINKNKACHTEPNELINILFFGQISFYKGVDILIESGAFLKNRNFQFHIYGRSELDEKKLFDLASSNGMSRHVSWKIKFLSNLEVHNAFLAADILVFPYRHIDQSAVLMSALDYGKPIVASRIGGFEEILEHEVNGLLFEKENPKDLALQLDQLIRSPHEREIFGNANLELSRSWPSWSEIAKTTLNIYR